MYHTVGWRQVLTVRTFLATFSACRTELQNATVGVEAMPSKDVYPFFIAFFMSMYSGYDPSSRLVDSGISLQR